MVILFAVNMFDLGGERSITLIHLLINSVVDICFTV